MPETNPSLEWNIKLAGNPELKTEPKGFSMYNETKQMLSTTNIRIPPPYRMQENIISQPVKSRADSLEKEQGNISNKKLAINFNKPAIKKRNRSGTKTPLLTVNTAEKSPKLLDSSGYTRHVSFQNLSMNTISSSVKKKMQWHMDSSSLLPAKRVANIMKVMKNNPLDEESASYVSSSMMHLSDYFEVMLNKLFNENRLKFASSSFFRTLFAEEFNREPAKKTYIEDFNKPTPVEFT